MNRMLSEAYLQRSVSAILLLTCPKAATVLKILQITAGGVSALFVIALMLGSASAVPVLSVGADANYRLNASIQQTQSCSASPMGSALATYNQTACGPPQQRSLIRINDNGTCVSTTSCYYSPSSFYCSPSILYCYYLPLGTTVMWFNYGSQDHTVTSVSSPPGVQPFDSGPIHHYGSFFATFNIAGNYSYHDSLNPLLRGNLTVSNIPSPVPPISSQITPTISLDGTIGWTVEGIDNSVAVLNVSHQVSIVAAAGPISFTPVTETGSFSQSVDLATRVESSGTTTSLVLGLVQRMLNYYPGYYGYGYSPAIGQLLSSQKNVYTFWWVNGPLTNGSPVEILTGYSAVTGSEAVNLGPGNNRNAWIVESELSQSVSTTSPPVVTSGGSTYSSLKLDMRFDYDQASDLLLKSNTVIAVSSSQTQEYNPGDMLCGPSGCFPVSDHVIVNHHMSATIPISLQLTSTNLDLAKRTQGPIGNGQASTGGPGGTSGAPALPVGASVWIIVGVGIGGVGVIGTLAWWLLRRSRSRVPTFESRVPPAVSSGTIP